MLCLLSVTVHGQICKNGTCPTLPTGITTSDNYQTFQGTTVDTTYPSQGGNATCNGPTTGPVYCPLNGTDLFTVFGLVQPGETIVLQAGTSYIATHVGLGNVNSNAGFWQLPAKLSNPNHQWILVVSSHVSERGGALPGPGIRVNPQQLPDMATLTTQHSNTAILLNYAQVAGDQGMWYFEGIELTPNSSLNCVYNAPPTPVANCYINSLVAVAGNEIVFDRCYMHGEDGIGTDTTNNLGRKDIQRALIINSQNPAVAANSTVAVINSWISQIHGPGTGPDSQGIGSIGNNGKQKYNNNYISATGEAYINGGSLNWSGGHNMDVEMQHNYIRPDPAWLDTQIGTISTISRTLQTFTITSLLRNSVTNATTGVASGTNVTATLAANPATPIATSGNGQAVMVNVAGVADSSFNGTFQITAANTTNHTVAWTQAGTAGATSTGGAVTMALTTATFTAAPNPMIYVPTVIWIRGVADITFNGAFRLASVSGSTLQWYQSVGAAPGTSAPNASSTGGTAHLDYTWANPTAVWTLKTAFECKDGGRELFYGNVIAGQWAYGMNCNAPGWVNGACAGVQGVSEHGQAIRVTPRSTGYDYVSQGTASCDDITIVSNYVLGSNVGIAYATSNGNCTNNNGGQPALAWCLNQGTAWRNLYYNNLYVARDTTAMGSDPNQAGSFLTTYTGRADATAAHNTSVQPNFTWSIAYGGEPGMGNGQFGNTGFYTNPTGNSSGTGYTVGDTGNISTCGTGVYTVTNVCTSPYNLGTPPTAANCGVPGAVIGFTVNPAAFKGEPCVPGTNIPTTPIINHSGVATGLTMTIFQPGPWANFWYNNNVTWVGLGRIYGPSTLVTANAGGAGAFMPLPSTAPNDISYRFTGNLMGTRPGWVAQDWSQMATLQVSPNPTCNGVGNASCWNLNCGPTGTCSSASTAAGGNGWSSSTPFSMIPGQFYVNPTDCISATCDYSLVTPYMGTDATPSGINMALLKNATAFAISGNPSLQPPPTFTISGTVSGAVSSGISVQLTGTGTGQTFTDASGNYSFAGRVAGTYTITPVLAGYSFTPASITVNLTNANSTGHNFTSAQIVTYSISGQITGAISSGITVSLSGTATQHTVTDASGNYSFTSLAPGAYNVTPSDATNTYGFAPASISAIITNTNLTGQNFVSSLLPTTFTIDGTIGGAILAGVTITTGTYSAISDVNGNYVIHGVPNGTYTLVPSLAGYTFTPISLVATVNGADVLGQDFTASVAPIVPSPAGFAIGHIGPGLGRAAPQTQPAPKKQPKKPPPKKEQQ